ncbi:hypothetical protein OROMI_014334 [Orobanche minor]
MMQMLLMIDYKKVGVTNGSLTFSAQSTESDQQNDDITGHPRRKARKVRLLTEMLTEKPHHINRKESTKLPELTPTSSSPLKKRKIQQVHEWKPIDVTSKKVKVVKGDFAVKTSIVEHSQDLEPEGGQNTDKYQCKKHGSQKGSKLGKVSSDSFAVWRSIFNDMGRSDKDKVKVNSLPNDSSRPNHDIFEGKQNHPMRGSQCQSQSQSDTGLGLGLSLNYDSQSRVSWMPPLPNRVPIHDHSRKDGFVFGESSFGHKGVVLDSQVNGRSVYNVRDGNSSRTSFLQDQQPFHSQLSHGNFSHHQNLDFSDPHNKRNNGVRGYSDLMRTHNYQRQDVFSNGRSDEREIVELMAKIQHERNLSEVRNYNEIPNSSNYHKLTTFNQPIFIPHHQYPTIRRPSSSTIPTTGFFHQEQPNPSFPNFDTFSQNHIRVSDNSHNRIIPHQAAPTNMQIMEAYNNGRPGNVWSNMEMHTKWSNRNKGKNIMNLDLNVMAPNVLEDQTHTGGGSLDRSYSNEAIPAMQLLSLMDAGKNPPIVERKKHTQKPFSCYNGVKQSSFSYSGVQSGVVKPVESSRNFIMGHGACSHSLPPVTNSFSSFFQTDLGTHGSQFFHKSQEKKQRVSVIGQRYSPEDSFGFPLPWHASEGGALGTRNVRPETEICTFNQNPADFSTPGPENVYMIDVENLKFRGDRVFYPREGTV